jgi:hypothetical protein
LLWNFENDIIILIPQNENAVLEGEGPNFEIRDWHRAWRRRSIVCLSS